MLDPAQRWTAGNISQIATATASAAPAIHKFRLPRGLFSNTTSCAEVSAILNVFTPDVQNNRRWSDQIGYLSMQNWTFFQQEWLNPDITMRSRAG